MKNKKVAMIGAGYVGAAAAFSIMLDGIADEIVLVDIDTEKAAGEANDIAHGIKGIANTAVYAGDYSDCCGSSIIIITAGRGRKPTGAVRITPPQPLELLMGSATEPILPLLRALRQVPPGARLA